MSTLTKKLRLTFLILLRALIGPFCKLAPGRFTANFGSNNNLLNQIALKNLQLIFFGLFAAGGVHSQSLSLNVIAAAGNHFNGNNAQLSWTIGEPVTETFAANAIQLTQGFHQTNLTIVAVTDPVAGFQVRVYPNPTADRVNIESLGYTSVFSMALSDALGRTLLFQSATQSGLRSLDLSGYAAGVYYLRLRVEDPKTVQTFKIIKQNQP